jgi:predicted site-specific integrase-resolvase
MNHKKPLKEAAFCIGVHWRTLYRWTIEGKIAFIQHSTNSPIFIPEKEIERVCKEKMLPK